MDATIRPVTTEAELETWLAVRNAVDPRPMTLAGLRAERSADTTALDLIAWVHDTAVGAAATGWGPISDESRMTWVWIWVLPEHRHRGIGGRMFDRLAAFARDGGMERVTGVVVEGDTDSLRFCERRGLEVDGAGSLGHLDLTAADLDDRRRLDRWRDHHHPGRPAGPRASPV